MNALLTLTKVVNLIPLQPSFRQLDLLVGKLLGTTMFLGCFEDLHGVKSWLLEER